MALWRNGNMHMEFEWAMVDFDMENFKKQKIPRA